MKAHVTKKKHSEPCSMGRTDPCGAYNESYGEPYRLDRGKALLGVIGLSIIRHHRRRVRDTPHRQSTGLRFCPI